MLPTTRAAPKQEKQQRFQQAKWLEFPQTEVRLEKTVVKRQFVKLKRLKHPRAKAVAQTEP